MKFIPFKKFGRSLLRIMFLLTVILGGATLCYLLWNPGSDDPLPDYSDNAIWIGHGWLGDNAWFERKQIDPADFRSEANIAALFRRLADNKISIVYPHLCPARPDGLIARCDHAQTERFLDFAEQFGIRVIPWIGGVFGTSACPADVEWRKHFVESVSDLMNTHPRLAGVQINIEPMPDGNADFLTLLDELRATIPGKILSVAAYPPPTTWHRFPDVHWSLEYLCKVANRCDQMAVMMYDTSIQLEKVYIDLTTRWTAQLTETLRSIDCDLLLGIPAYEDADVGYHHPRVENIISALRGVSAADPGQDIRGIAVYCEWEMNETKWREWRRMIPGCIND